MQPPISPPEPAHTHSKPSAAEIAKELLRFAPFDSAVIEQELSRRNISEETRNEIERLLAWAKTLC